MTSTAGRAAYLEALRSLESELSPSDWDILWTQHSAPDQTMTATECARVVGSDSYRTGNLRYGKLGRRFAAVMPQIDLPRRARGAPKFWVAISTGARSASGEFEWTLQEGLSDALDAFAGPTR